MTDEENIIRKLENFVCDNKENNRVVSVEIDKHIDKIIDSNYVVTNITIHAMNDEIAHALDDLKWREGNLVDYLERELERESLRGQIE